VTASIDGGAYSLSATVTFESGPPAEATSQLEASPSTVVADGTAESTLTVTVFDAQNNPVSGVDVALSVSGSDNDLAPTSGTTDANGQLTASLSSTTAEQKTVTASIDGGAFSLTSAVTFQPGAPDEGNSTLVANPDTVVANGSDESILTVTVLDAQGNPVPGVDVASTVSGSDNDLMPTSGTTDTNGEFTASLSSTTAEGKTVTASIDGGAFELYAPVTFEAGPVSASQSILSADPNTVEADGTETTTVTVVARDDYDNPIGGASVQLATSGSSSISQPGPTDSTGTTTGDISSTEDGVQTISATIDSTTIDDTADVDFQGCNLSAGHVETFNPAGSRQSYDIPDGCGGTWRLSSYGGQGGCEESDCSSSSSHLGGRGGHVRGDITLTDTDTLYIRVGEAGGNDCNGTGGSPGGGDGGGCGGGGGGYSTIRLNGTDPSDQLLVAGGGGGGDDGPYCGSSTGHDWMQGGHTNSTYTISGMNADNACDCTGGGGGGYNAGVSSCSGVISCDSGAGGGTNYIDASLSNTVDQAGVRGNDGCNQNPVDGLVELTYDP
jgi:hypothetical protein